MQKLLIVVFSCLAFAACKSQTSDRVVGGPCQGCEALLEYGDKPLTAVDTLPKFAETEPKLKLSGTVYQKDGKTPAQNVILYFHQTNRKGIYETKGDEQGWARRHGFIRGWVKTGPDGRYTVYTFRPASYPNTSEPEHIHITVKEPGLVSYYIDSVVFTDDPFLTAEEKAGLNGRGGSGVVTPIKEANMLTVQRDIILGKNIPDY